MVSNYDASAHEEQQYRAVLKARVLQIEADAAELRTQRERIDERLSALGDELIHLRALLGPGEQPATPAFTAHRVATPTDVVRLLEQVNKPLHYREIERLLREQGFDTGRGADPANVLLARYHNDGRLYRPSRGTYALRAWADSKNVQSVGQRRRRPKRQ